MKLQRLEDSMARTKKDRDGIQKLVKIYSESPSFSNRKSLEETEQQLEECDLKLDLLEATHCKLSASLAESEGKPGSFHRFRGSISRWKDKDCEHSVVQLTRPVKLRRTPLRSRRSLRASIVYKGPSPFGNQPAVERPLSAADLLTTGAVECDGTIRRASHHADDGGRGKGQAAQEISTGACRALYSFTPQHLDELTLKEGDLLDVYSKGENGWWYGALRGRRGHFPSSYVEELPRSGGVRSPDA